MKKTAIIGLFASMVLILTACGKAETTAITDSLSIALPKDIVSFTAEEAGKNESFKPILEAVSDGAENLYIGALPAGGSGPDLFSSVYIIQREAEAAAATGTSGVGTYADTNEFAFGLSQWYKEYFPDFYIVDVLSGTDGAPVFVVHAETEDGIALLGETYSTDYSDSIIACFFDEHGNAVEPTQAQYEAFVSMLKTIEVK